MVPCNTLTKELVVAAQIETREAVDNLVDMVQVLGALWYLGNWGYWGHLSNCAIRVV